MQQIYKQARLFVYIKDQERQGIMSKIVLMSFKWEKQQCFFRYFMLSLLKIHQFSQSQHIQQSSLCPSFLLPLSNPLRKRCFILQIIILSILQYYQNPTPANPMEKCIYNPKDYIKNNKNFEDYQCGICFDLSIDPVKCKGPCKKVFCMDCVSKVKNIIDRCPNRCSKPFFATKIPPLKFQFNCPYNQTCQISIRSPQEFYQHFQVCPFTPVSQKAKRKLKKEYKCPKQHNLQFFVGKYNEMISSICSECSVQKLCRSICRKCDQKYCIDCRMPPCSKKTCPIGHQFSLFKDPNLQYICDVCGMNASMFNTGIYDDKACNFGICQNCIEKLPQEVDNKHLTRLINNQEKCQCGNDLLYIPQKKANCCLCQRWKNCPKYCPSCDLNFCLKCKNVSIYEDICEFQHQYTVTMPEDCNVSGCMRCDKAATYYMEDKQCKIILCQECKDYFSAITGDKLRLRPVYCDEGHKLFFMKPNIGNCKRCKNMKEMELICLQCQSKEVQYCFQCKPIPLSTCYFDHPLRDSTNQSQTMPCSVCSSQTSQYKYCLKCKFYACQTCHTSSLSTQASLSQQMLQLYIS